jgi:hypothetical protein
MIYAETELSVHDTLDVMRPLPVFSWAFQSDGYIVIKTSDGDEAEFVVHGPIRMVNTLQDIYYIERDTAFPFNAFWSRMKKTYNVLQENHVIADDLDD